MAATECDERSSCPENARASALRYSDYLRLDRLLAAQRPLSDPPHPDELLFIIQHQTSELWMKLVLHELMGAGRCLDADEADQSLKHLARVRLVQRQLFDQWAVLETLTPAEYAHFRDGLGNASGFQSFQFRAIECLLGAREPGLLEGFRNEPPSHAQLRELFEAPALFDVFLRYLARQGYALPRHCTERDWREPRKPDEAVTRVLLEVYQQPDAHWAAYALCERFMDLEEQFQLWRFRHVRTVERIIGHKPGTGGTSGVSYLESTVGRRFFPELIDVRTLL
ncbi:MAG: tryptophan 2,3-dioxygenase family protein [Pseudomonadota bacterium]|nr:tryptophan 2,3-dioxygenase family protein [Pseudomonadota bacterium]